MPKKFLGENTKATVAKARKAAAEAEKTEQRKKAEEDASWEDDDKNAARKQQRKDEQEKKRLEALQRKQASKAALEEEMNSLGATSSPKTAQPTKVTRAELDAQKERLAAQRLKDQQLKELEAKKIAVQAEEKLEQNVNRIVIEGDVARTVDEAISVLGDKSAEVDRHPEKRMKAAYIAFEEANLPRLKQEHPTQRLSQLKQMLKKEWLKSPENPLNQRLLDLQNRGGSSEED